MLKNKFWGDHKTRTILSDFPWLWAVRSEWFPALAHQVKVSQNMADLRFLLQQKSVTTDDTEVWIVLQRENRVSREVRRMVSSESETWAERIDNLRSSNQIGLLYIVLYRSLQFVIFRDPKNNNMDEHVGSVVHLTGKHNSTT